MTTAIKINKESLKEFNTIDALKELVHSGRDAHENGRKYGVAFWRQAFIDAVKLHQIDLVLVDRVDSPVGYGHYTGVVTPRNMATDLTSQVWYEKWDSTHKQTVTYYSWEIDQYLTDIEKLFDKLLYRSDYTDDYLYELQ